MLWGYVAAEIYNPVEVTPEILQWRIKNEGLDSGQAERISASWKNPMLQSAAGFKTNYEVKMALFSEQQKALEDEAKKMATDESSAKARRKADAQAKAATYAAADAKTMKSGSGSAKGIGIDFGTSGVSLGGTLPYGPTGGVPTLLGY